MLVALFGITDEGLNLFVNLVLLFLVVVWIALVAWTFLDARRRTEDPVLVACATGASLFPFVGTVVYAILRPPEFLEDARERELEIRAAELRVRQLSELSCPNCGFPVEKNYLRCPNCQRRLKDPCHSCGKPVDPRWALCPYCESALPGRGRQQQRAPQAPRRGEQRQDGERRSAPPPRGERQQRSSQREATREAPRQAPASRSQRAPARQDGTEEEQPARPKS